MAQGIAIGGFIGVGKTTTGRALSAATTLPLVDMDDILTARFGPISRQFERDGERAFRARERALLEELCDGHARVLSTGGGVWVPDLHRRWLREQPEPGQQGEPRPGQPELRLPAREPARALRPEPERPRRHHPRYR